MELITEGRRLERRLARSLERHGTASFASAWASAGTTFFEALASAPDRIGLGVVGTHFCQTDPDFMDAFVDAANVRFVLQPSGVFHPKVVIFGDEHRWEAFVGSANLTKGAFHRNAEAVVRFDQDDDPTGTVREELLARVERWFDSAEPATAETAARYRAEWSRRRPLLDRLDGSYGASRSKAPLATTTMTLPWADFYARVRREEHFRERLEVLRLAREAFAESRTFDGMPTEQQKLVAGVPNEVVEKWGLFGSMFGAGRFRTVLNGRSPELAAAIDGVPMAGDVTEDDYRTYVDRFCSAFPNGRDGIGSATRLLAMKRPDQFVCFNARDRRGIAEDFGLTSPNAIGYDRYWSEVVARIRDSAWYASPRPSRGRELEAWLGRVAMMDAIFYQGQTTGRAMS